ncbi:hypothetical protein [Pseudomonas sp. T1.Ur]|uniref:hypothetical protein n=1 Tax=Pseudomonas sp. T1.Ur TaxID=2928704 RepID=UPI00201D5D8C|nr:hypothetical protein [Pseudomonas sp. T1.Ur]MCL6705197.1 hypothetical protein [Pseudomonas sp. T1.Ur]
MGVDNRMTSAAAMSWLVHASGSDHAQFIPAIRQDGNRQEQGEIVENNGVGTEFLAKGDVFQQLGHGADAVGGGFLEDVEGERRLWLKIARVGLWTLCRRCRVKRGCDLSPST